MDLGQRQCQANILAVDIGGTLKKVALSCRSNIVKQVFYSFSDSQVDHLEIMSQSLGKNNSLNMYMVTFSNIEDLFMFLQMNVMKNFQNLKIVATGGGALKYQSKFQQLLEKAQKQNKLFEFKVQMNEFETIISAMQLLIAKKTKIMLKRGYKNTDKLVIQGKRNQQFQQKNEQSDQFQVPLILANIGSGMSVLKLQFNENKILEFTRIGGSALGGGFLTGLQKIVNQNFSFQKFKGNSLTQQEIEIMQQCVTNMSQIVSLYSDIYHINTILITGGMAKADIIQNEFAQNLPHKKIFFTQIDGLLSVIGIVFFEWRRLRSTQ